MRILFKFATRARPYLFLRSLDNIQSTISTDDYEILVTADTDDVTMNSDYLKAQVEKYKNITWAWGESKGKVDAINRDMDKATKPWDILINMSDDMQFQFPGWDEVMIAKIKETWNDLDFFAHFNDGFTGEAIPSMSIMGRKYAERFFIDDDGSYVALSRPYSKEELQKIERGRKICIYHPSYLSLWSDNEAMEVAKLLGKHKYFEEVIFKHIHPATVGLPQDNLYKFNEQWYDIDKVNFEYRKTINFEIAA